MCLLTFGIVQPAFAERTWGEVGLDTVEGAGKGGLWGGVIGAAYVASVFFSGGGTLPLLPYVLGVAAAGAGIGGVAGAAGQKEKIDALGTEALVGVGLTSLAGQKPVPQPVPQK